MLYVKPGKLIVLEGLDGTGKSTQLDTLRRHASTAFADPVPYMSTQPRGDSVLGAEIYKITESIRDMNPWTRQFLHLASHATHYDRIFEELEERAVILDRCWWSTVAYGWYDGALHEQVPLEVFEWLATVPAQNRPPDLVCLFMNPHVEDYHNTDALVEGYRKLRDRYVDTTVLIGKGTKRQQTEQILRAMVNYGCAETIPPAA
jgi:thymidylate kinase